MGALSLTLLSISPRLSTDLITLAYSRKDRLALSGTVSRKEFFRKKRKFQAVLRSISLEQREGNTKNRDVQVSDSDCSRSGRERVKEASSFRPPPVSSFNVLFSPRGEPPADAILGSNLYLIKQVSVSPSWPAEDRSSPAFGLRVGVH